MLSARTLARPAPRALAVLLVSIVGWCVLAALCARYDLAISRTLVDRGAAWAAFGERYGTLPGAYALATAAAVCYGKPNRRARSALTLVGLWLLCTLCVALAIAVSAYRLLGYKLSLAEALGTSAAVACLSWLLRWRWRSARPSSARAERTCSWILLLGVTSWLVVHAAKWTWGRVRFRDLDEIGAGFTPWYLPQGPTGHGSFPSGHTAMGWLLLPCLLLWPRGSALHRLAALASIAWGCFVAASRVVIGAHYASDVLFSTAFAVTVVSYALLAAPAAPVTVRD